MFGTAFTVLTHAFHYDEDPVDPVVVRLILDRIRLNRWAKITPSKALRTSRE